MGAAGGGVCRHGAGGRESLVEQRAVDGCDARRGTAVPEVFPLMAATLCACKPVCFALVESVQMCPAATVLWQLREQARTARLRAATWKDRIEGEAACEQGR